MLPLDMSSIPSKPETVRRLPSQERSRKTFERILVATAGLLEEVGFSNFTTNLLSERTGISVRAIYRYFPNKHALVIELATRLANEWRSNLGTTEKSALVNADKTWHELWPAYLDQYVAAVRRSPGGVAIIQAMRTDPQLRAFDDEVNEQYIRDITLALCVRNTALASDTADTLARVLMKSTVAIIDTIFEVPTEQAEKMLDMLKAMHLGLIEQWLEEKR